MLVPISFNAVQACFAELQVLRGIFQDGYQKLKQPLSAMPVDFDQGLSIVARWRQCLQDVNYAEEWRQGLQDYLLEMQGSLVQLKLLNRWRFLLSYAEAALAGKPLAALPTVFWQQHHDHSLCVAAGWSAIEQALLAVVDHPVFQAYQALRGFLQECEDRQIMQLCKQCWLWVFQRVTERYQDFSLWFWGCRGRWCVPLLLELEEQWNQYNQLPEKTCARLSWYRWSVGEACQSMQPFEALVVNDRHALPIEGLLHSLFHAWPTATLAAFTAVQAKAWGLWLHQQGESCLRLRLWAVAAQPVKQALTQHLIDELRGYFAREGYQSLHSGRWVLWLDVQLTRSLHWRALCSQHWQETLQTLTWVHQEAPLAFVWCLGESEEGQVYRQALQTLGMNERR